PFGPAAGPRRAARRNTDEGLAPGASSLPPRRAKTRRRANVAGQEPAAYLQHALSHTYARGSECGGNARPRVSRAIDVLVAKKEERGRGSCTGKSKFRRGYMMPAWLQSLLTSSSKRANSHSMPSITGDSRSGVNPTPATFAADSG